MARQTFQARLRSTAGTYRSVQDRRDGKTRSVLAYNFAGPIQMAIVGLGDEALEVGFIPAHFCLTEIAVIQAAGAGTIAVDLPAYGGLGATNLVAALADPTVIGPLALAAPLYSNFSIPRPVVVTGVGVTGTLRLGIFGFPLDDARVEFS